MKVLQVDQMKLRTEKVAKDYAWYKHNIDSLISRAVGGNDTMGFDIDPRKREMRVNRDLLNNIMDYEDFRYVFSPYGDDIGDLPANFVNRDIISSKVNSFVGLEKERPFEWGVMATNPEAVNRRIEAEQERLRDWLNSELMLPLQIEQAVQEAEASAGRKLTPAELNTLQEQVISQQHTDPIKIRDYMQREHKDTVELACQQLLSYHIKAEKLIQKFRDGLRTAAATAYDLYYVGISGGRPVVEVADPEGFYCDLPSNSDYVHESSIQVMEYRMSPSDIINEFHRELTKEEIKRIFEWYNDSGMFGSWEFSRGEGEGFVSVWHVVWRGLRKVGYLTYRDEEGNEQESMVSEDYKLDKQNGDISIEWDWIDEIEQGYRIGADIYKRMGPLPNQDSDLEAITRKRMPYIGVVWGGRDGTPTSLVSRIKEYQYLYNIIIYRIELMLASDKGKKVFMNLNMIPKKKGWDTKKFLHFLDSNSIGLLDPAQEGGGDHTDITTAVKEVDLSYISKIMDYVNFAEYIDRRAGESVGIPKALEAQTQEREAVQNVQANISAATNMLEPYYAMHDAVKQEVLQALLDYSRIAYAEKDKVSLSYIADDMTMAWLSINPEMLSSETLGVFVNDPDTAARANHAIRTAADIALQSKQLEFGDYLDLIVSMNVPQAKAKLRESQMAREDFEKQLEEIKGRNEERQAANKQAEEELRHANKLEEIRVKAEEDRRTAYGKAAIMATGFLEDKDQDRDNVPDPIQYAEMFIKQEDQRIKREEIASKERIAKDSNETKLKQSRAKKDK